MEAQDPYLPARQALEELKIARQGLDLAEPEFVEVAILKLCAAEKQVQAVFQELRQGGSAGGHE